MQVRWLERRVSGAWGRRFFVLGTLVAMALLVAPLAQCGGARRDPAVSAPPPPPAVTPTHTVTLNWEPSSSPVVGYYVYRADSPAGPFAKLNPTPITATQFRDSTVVAGQTYTYATTAVDAQGVESAFSNLITVTIPNH